MAITRLASPSFDFGPLSYLEDTWLGDTGYNLMVVPQGAPDGSITFLVMIHQLFETHIFDRVGAPVPNRSGQGKEQIMAVKYTQVVAENVSKNVLHQEVGMWMYQTPPQQDEPTWSQPIPGFTATNPITRQGIIPHGNSILLAGNFDTNPVPEYPSTTTVFNPEVISVNGDPNSTLKDQMETALQQAYNAQINTALASLPASQTAGLNLQSFLYPTTILTNQTKSLTFQDVTNMHVNAANAAGYGGVDSIPFAHQFANPVDFDAYLSIQHVINPSFSANPDLANTEDEVADYLQAQYFQNISIQFEITLNGNKVVAKFPHFQFNTLVKI